MPKSQLEFAIDRPEFPDRNSTKGGRSFYFFDLDDNVLFMPTQIYLLPNLPHLSEIAVSTDRFSKIAGSVGRAGPLEHYSILDTGLSGSFRDFRDDPKLSSNEQHFFTELSASIKEHDHVWKAPSWSFFEHAVHNQRPIAIITARGHKPSTIVSGLMHLFSEEILTKAPHLFAVYPVTNPKIRLALGDTETDPKRQVSVAELKYRAIIDAVDKAEALFGRSPYHRFGMSDDDTQNLELIRRAMRRLKSIRPDNAFYVIDASDATLKREEILSNESSQIIEATQSEQLGLFVDA